MVQIELNHNKTQDICQPQHRISTAHLVLSKAYCNQINAHQLTHVAGRQDPILGDQHAGTTSKGRAAVHGGGEERKSVRRDIESVDNVGRRTAEISGVGWFDLGVSIGDVGGAVSPEDVARFQVVISSVSSDARAAMAVFIIVSGTFQNGCITTISLTPGRGWLKEVRDGQVSPIS